MPIIMKKLFLFILTGLLLGSCDRFDEKLNINPNLPSQASNTQLLASAMRSLPGTSSSAYGPLYPQHLSETIYTDASRYNTTFFNFYDWYYSPLADIESVLTSNKLTVSEGPIANQLAVAKILKAYYFWFMTDRWGDLPYSQALKGKENLTPAYDTQQDIYNALFTLLDEANGEMVTGNITNDIVYGGNTVKWKQLGNTIHLLMALRLSKVDPAKGRTEFNKALAAGIIQSNADNLVYTHLKDANNQNYWYEVFSVLNRQWYAVSKPLVDYMQTTNDPRLKTYANPNAAGQYVGLEYGLSGDQANTGRYVIRNISLLGESLRQQNSPVYLVTYAQALFARAEAAKLGWIPGGDAEAEKNYTLAIEASVKQWNKDDVTGLGAMIANPEVKYNPADALKQIGYQRWVHLFLNGYEAWAEWRRTGYPQLQAPANNSGRSIPRREAYPNQENLNNKAHYEEAVQRLGGTNDLNGRVWWDRP